MTSSTQKEMSTQVSQLTTQTTDVPWFQRTPNPSQIPPSAYDLLEHYSHIPRATIDAHITAIRNKAWSIFPYPCIGQWRFLDLSISQQPAYAKVLAALKEKEKTCSDSNSEHSRKTENEDDAAGAREQKTLLDLGCCFAQDIRKLIYDGAPADALYACDLKPEFLELGYDLFADRASCKANFFTADVLSEEDDDKNNDKTDNEKGRQEGLTGLAALRGKIDIVYASSFLHIFSWDDQVRIATKIIEVLRPRKGSLVFGRQTGNLRGQETRSAMERLGQDDGAKKVWRHDVESFQRLWEVAGQQTGSRWGVWAELYETPMTKEGWAEEGIRMLRFEVRRLEE